jgi:Lar family restriction alleviation protein
MPTHAEQHPAPALLPCPFCGDASRTFVTGDETDGFYVECMGCSAFGPALSDAKEEAVALWNGRSLAGLGLSSIEATGHTMRIKDGVLSIDHPLDHTELLAALRKVTARLRAHYDSYAVEPDDLLEAEVLLKRIDEKGGRDG